MAVVAPTWVERTTVRSAIACHSRWDLSSRATMVSLTFCPLLWFKALVLLPPFPQITFRTETEAF